MGLLGEGRGRDDTRRRLRLILAWTVGHGPGPRLLNRGAARAGVGGHRGSFNAGLGRREIAVRFAKSMDYQTTQGPLHGGMRVNAGVGGGVQFYCPC